MTTFKTAEAANSWSRSPHTSVSLCYEQVWHNEMRDMPFCNQALAVHCPVFTLYEGQWLGMILTPWMLSLLVFPGPEQVWPSRKTGEKIALNLLQQNYTFIVNEHPELGSYLACSLMSPVTQLSDFAAAKTLCKSIMLKLTEIPLHVQDNVDISRRRLFRGSTSKLETSGY